MRHGNELEPDAPRAGVAQAGARPQRRPPRRVPLLVAGLVAVLTFGSGCTANGLTPAPDLEAATRAAQALATALAAKNLTPVPFTGATGAEVNELFQPLVRGMGPVRPTVSVGAVTASGSSATAGLTLSWAFPGVPQPWTYDTSVRFSQDSGQWKATWAPAVVEPRLDGTNRLTQHRLYAERGELLGQDGEPIVAQRSIVRIGLDRVELTGDQIAGSAARLARLVKVDPRAYAARVEAAGAEAFVEAITFRADDLQRPTNPAVSAIPGALAIEGSAMLAPDREFARALIGTVGDATAEVVTASGGAVVAGDQVGLSGLQRRYDQRLRGTPGVQVQLVAATPSSAFPTPTASPPTPSSPSPRPTDSPSAPARVTAYEVRPVAGKELTTTLNVDLQKLAEKTLASTKPAAALVALRPSDGAILAAANGPGALGQPIATTGQVPPGSTFKVASALALLRSGLTTTSKVSCPTTVTVDGRRFENYNDYPAGSRGTITLQTALAQSCNTAFIGQRSRLKEDDLARAAASLGIGTDYDVGFPAFFGSVPAGGSATGRAAAMIGQGQVTVSPMAMAGVAASVEAGKTVLPNLVADQRATSTAPPLTGAEAAQLKQMMRAVVTQGTGASALLGRRGCHCQDRYRGVRHRHPAQDPRLDGGRDGRPRGGRVRQRRQLGLGGGGAAAGGVPARRRMTRTGPPPGARHSCCARHH